ncbi:sensor histidine kinase [Sphaerisporangium aureirubrum]|uniref:histidine kinase n=1 Tax=Sphaerisporangium aureirubrum TaxID=1544736 RepID=A0ABW1NGC4_9ACTN
MRWRGVPGDAWLGGVFVLVLALWAFQLAWARGGDKWQFGVATGVVVCAIALRRGRGRVWAAVAGMVVAAAAAVVARLAELPSEPGPAMALALAVLVGSAVRVLPVLTAGAVAAGGFLVVAVCGFAAATAGLPSVMVLNGVAWLAALAVGLNLRMFDMNRRVVAEKVRRDERLALARELHDVVAHHITGIVVQSQAARLVARKHPEKLADSLAGIEGAGSEALAAMRSVVGILRDADDAPPATPAPEGLGDLVGRFSSHGLPVHLRLPDHDLEWPPEITSTVYRVVQESLTNVSRHAPHAASATVSVTENRNIVTVEVSDDAPQLPTRHRTGYGLTGMRERLEALGGTLHAGPAPGTGWSVLATLPVPTRRRR